MGNLETIKKNYSNVVYIDVVASSRTIAATVRPGSKHIDIKHVLVKKVQYMDAHLKHKVLKIQYFGLSNK